MIDITHRIGIRASIARVQSAVASVKGVAGWWTTDTSGEYALGQNLTMRFANPEGQELGRMVFKVTRMEARKVEWQCLEGPAEWVGTFVTFDLSESNGQTILLFGHRGWKELVEFTAHCSMKWATFLLSLREFAETGTGRPSPHDLKIDDWN
ncbi:MAG: SRPBCC domain-containing protein [Opitutaceae bacterium]|nr:SRPBCC domain-containing protein [Opitutaceae bacterium]